MKLNSLIDVMNHFSDNDTCIDYLKSLRWGNSGVKCPHCAAKKVYELKGANKRYKCAKCRKQFSAVKGTIFENSAVPLKKWFVAVYLIATHQPGISSVQLGEHLGVTQKTAWFMAQRIRYALKSKSFENKKLSGLVQVDETYIGGSTENMHAEKKKKSKTIVAGIVSHGGTVRTKVVPDATSASLRPFIRQAVSEGSIVVSDEWPGYRGLEYNFERVVLHHAKKEYARGVFHTNRIEGFWSILKRGIRGVYIQVSPKHLHRYCDEFAFRYNNRKMNCQQVFAAVMAAVTCRLTYKELVN